MHVRLPEHARGPRGQAENPLVTVSLQVRQGQRAALARLADMAHTSGATSVREAIERLLTRLKGLLTGVKRPLSWRMAGA